MKIILLSACALLILIIVVGHSHGEPEPEPAPKTKLTVYYESLCKDSKKFMKTQVHPLLDSPMGKYVDIELVPYGKANTTGEAGSYQFSCHSGEKECEGNRLHACAIKILGNRKAACVIECSMSQDFPPAHVEPCMTERKLDFGPVGACAGSPEGMELLAMHGQKTKALEPKLTFVPWIIFDGVWSDDIMQKSLQDLQAVVCDKIGKDLCEAAKAAKS